MRTEAPEEKPAAAPKASRRQRRGKGSSGGDGFAQRVLPRTVIGTIVLLLAAAVGFAFGGTVLFAYYQHRTDKLEKRISSFINGYEERVEEA